MESNQFCQWENEVFGFGYGTGEEYVLPLLRRFFLAFKDDSRSYDHHKLEQELTPEVAWLLINALCRFLRKPMDSVLEYGTSPRYGWLTEFGEQVRDFVLAKSDDELYELVSNYDPLPERRGND